MFAYLFIIFLKLQTLGLNYFPKLILRNGDEGSYLLLLQGIIILRLVIFFAVIQFCMTEFILIGGAPRYENKNLHYCVGRLEDEDVQHFAKRCNSHLHGK